MKHRTYIGFHLLTAIVLLLSLFGGLSSCQETFVEEKQLESQALYMSTSVQIVPSTRAPGTPVAEDEIVNTIRLIIFDSATGNVLHNVKHNASEFTKQLPGTASVWKHPFKITPGLRDFYFIANEDGWPTLSAALATITNRRQLYHDDAFTKLEYEPNYKPTATRPILMTQAYHGKNIQQIRNGKGTQADPQHFEAEGDERVELIRTLAKVRLTVRKVAYVEQTTAGYAASKLQFRNFKNFQALKLINVPQYFSLFANPYFSQQYLPGKNTTAELYNTLTPGTQEKVIEPNAAAGVVNNVATYHQASVTNVNTPSEGGGNHNTSVTQLYDYSTVMYVPEFLRAKGNLTEEKKGQDLSSKAMTLGFYSDGDILTYKASIDHGENKDVFDWTTNASSTSNTSKFVLPNAADTYSRYSVVRNNFYDIVAEEAYPQLHLCFNVRPWQDDFFHVYVGPYFNVYVDDPTFSSPTCKVRIITSEAHGVPADFRVCVMKVGTTETVTHTNPAHQSFTEHTFTLASPLAAGTNVLQIFYKHELLTTLKKP